MNLPPSVLLVTPHLPGLPGQERYADALAAHLALPCRRRSLARPAWARGPVLRTLAAWGSYPVTRPAPADTLVHGTDTFCAVPGADVVTVHDLIPLLHERQWTARAHMRIFGARLRRAHLITPTRTWAERIERVLDGAPVHVVPQGCSVQAPRGEPTPPWPQDGKRTVLLAGAYREYKRFHLAITAAGAVRDLRVVRIGPVGRADYRDACHAAARRAGTDFLDLGELSDATLPHAYAAADLVVYLSQEEGFGFPPVEAMACGTPSLVSDLAVFRELHGDLVAYAGPDLGASLRAALDRPVEAAALRAHAARFTWERTAQATRDVYRAAWAERAQQHPRAVQRLRDAAARLPSAAPTPAAIAPSPLPQSQAPDETHSS